MPEQPNIILIMTDQQRGDALGIEGHPVLQTPCLDWIAQSGTRFTNAYSECPVCMPARRTIMSGQRPATHGVLGNYNTWLHGPTLPQVLRDNGYQTHLSGKLHLWPLRKGYGFEWMNLSDGPGASPEERDSDYMRFMRRERPEELHPQISHGIAGEGFPVRPWHLDERLHVCNWATDMAIDFLERRDPTRPFFLNLSYFHPHPPITPPQIFYDRYMAMDLPDPVVGEWARVYDAPQRGLQWHNPRQSLDPAVMKQYRAAYFAQISHIDNQIQRLFSSIAMIDGVDLSNTVILFASDHGDMLGDHQWHRKSVAYQGAVRIPLLLRLPDRLREEQGVVVDDPVGLQDIMPTLLDAAGVAVPDTVDGRSLVPLTRDADAEWREYIHGEIHQIPLANTGMHYLTNGRRKYVWYPGSDREEYFDLERSAAEEVESSDDAAYADEIARWRDLLTGELAGRPEGFVRDGRLACLGASTPIVLPGFELENGPGAHRA